MKKVKGEGKVKGEVKKENREKRKSNVKKKWEIFASQSDSKALLKSTWKVKKEDNQKHIEKINKLYRKYSKQ